MNTQILIERAGRVLQERLAKRLAARVAKEERQRNFRQLEDISCQQQWEAK